MIPCFSIPSPLFDIYSRKTHQRNKMSKVTDRKTSQGLPSLFLDWRSHGKRREEDCVVPGNQKERNPAFTTPD